MNDNVTLRVNGREWNGWTSVRIGAGIERLARDFSVEITRQWPGDEGITTLQPRIKNGSKVEVLIGDELVITGWVEATPVRYDARSVSTGIAGRSLTADLIDCAAEPTQFNGRSLVQIAQALAAPFGIEVVNSDAPSGVIPDVQPDHGETVIEVINKILGQQQALAYDDPHGRLVIGGIRECLQWMIDDGVVSRIDLDIRRTGINELGNSITLWRRDGPVMISFDDLWSAITYGGQ